MIKKDTIFPWNIYEVKCNTGIAKEMTQEPTLGSVS